MARSASFRFFSFLPLLVAPPSQLSFLFSSCVRARRLAGIHSWRAGFYKIVGIASSRFPSFLPPLFPPFFFFSIQVYGFIAERLRGLLLESETGRRREMIRRGFPFFPPPLLFSPCHALFQQSFFFCLSAFF